MTEIVYNGSDKKLTLLRPPILLRNENVEDFESLLQQLKQEIQPRGFIEEMYVGDIAGLVWEILRLRRLKTSIFNNAYQKALKNLLSQVLHDPLDQSIDGRHKPDRLSRQWFISSKARQEVGEFLAQHQLDEDSIIAEAFRLTASELERIDRMATLSEVRRERALSSIANYRLSLAKDLEQRSSRILENDAVAIEQ